MSIAYGIKHATNIMKRSGRDRENYLKERWLELAVNIFIIMTLPFNGLVREIGGSGGFIILGIIGGIVLYSLKIVD